ncbi:hypothetical protein [Brevundimonas sp.]|uniref:hypothetical protein n=1 Tax=Brevundimonas sp. TaxID=1871086 RepID=UPI002619F07E|nr:hypothetical protein [Brevundimonas sp.]
MRVYPALFMILTLGACGAPAASGSAEGPVSGPEAAASAPAEPMPGPLVRPAAVLEQACLDRVTEQFGQTGTSVTYEAQGPARATVSWAAPVDGGVLSFECRMGEAGADLFRDGRSVTVNVPTAADAAKQEAR